MGDLHSIAYSGCGSSSLNWEFYNLGVFNADISHPLMMCSGSTSPYFPSLDSDLSTGYLEDALFEFSSKRRRLLLFSDHHQTNYSTSSPTEISCWKENITEIYPENFGYLNRTMNQTNSVISCKKLEDNREVRREGNYVNTEAEEMKTILLSEEEDNEEARRSAFDYNSSSSPTIYSLKTLPIPHTLDSLDGPFPVSAAGGDEKKRKKIMTRVVYPFAVVKPGGMEGDVTLNDINQRILMPPTRPLRHPVGDFACRPMIVSPHGPGLSGKAVVAFTKIQTQGRGTITIIRTKG